MSPFLGGTYQLLSGNSMHMKVQNYYPRVGQIDCLKTVVITQNLSFFISLFPVARNIDANAPP